MTTTTTSKGRATSSCSRSKRVSSAKAHRKIDRSSAVQNLLRRTHADYEGYERQEGKLGTSHNEGEAERKNKETAERRLELESHSWVSKEDFGPHSVRCLGCNKNIQLDNRHEFYTTAWHKHVFRCAVIKADYFSHGKDLPFESLVAGIGREAAEICRDARESDRAKGVILQLTSDPAWVKPSRIPKFKKIRAVSTGSISSASSSRTTSSSYPSSSASVTPPAITPKLLLKSKRPRSSTSNSSTSSTSRSSSNSLPPYSPHSAVQSEGIQVDTVPYHETLAYQIELALPRIAASQGYFYCCGSLQQNRSDHELAHRLGYI
ncbi:uncharacterized protein C8R40DRAFT_1167171 [Lentinula edodes]|uniref:uncharacterized protein n=1 Tax=Lentinula edodes TaxID=5353 RepID=UPI001E8EC5BD|nr:uncharacterized protein C8R40DRAFT_1167171 [Lentinula edodes]KAH7878433.1 hypothetical protein C8R40DRAFT_1167171 [Lentinula edodes]